MVVFISNKLKETKTVTTEFLVIRKLHTDMPDSHCKLYFVPEMPREWASWYFEADN